MNATLTSVMILVQIDGEETPIDVHLQDVPVSGNRTSWPSNGVNPGGSETAAWADWSEQEIRDRINADLAEDDLSLKPGIEVRPILNEAILFIMEDQPELWN